MATLSPFPHTPSPFKTPNSKKLKTTSFNFKLFSSLKDENNNNNGDAGRETNEYEAFANYLRNPSLKTSLKSLKASLKASIKRNKMLNDRMLKELDEDFNKYPILANFDNDTRRMLVRKKERLQKAEETFTDLDLNKLNSCFGFDTFFVTDIPRYDDGGIFYGNLKGPIDEVIPKLEKKLSDAAGREVVLWFYQEEEQQQQEEEEEEYNITRQVCVVQPKEQLDLQFESNNLSNPFGYLSSIALAVTTFGTVASMSGSFLTPNATFGDYLASVVPLFGGFLFILGVSEIATRVTAARYGVKLSPSFLVPSIWTGCFGVMNNYESLLPNKKALFDISVARTASAYLTSLALAVAAFVAHGSFNGGDNALYIRPEFFDNNPLLSFIQLVIGPYTDDLGVVLPYAVEGVGVPVDPLAFAGLLDLDTTRLLRLNG
ncbi:probable zinc metallopeptidase EGY3, chloroplastic isoform X2 [Vicia villosa]|uniref:probable zinc metallopeptidase EGY3, chloroplastic isoform X2 n=1 Tax=Vicia villosa TaxID=3911 RepID=UPI00273CA794|nr:probable zinc metallopeptidase EGY3, chloroplastic isoform X2 [Vicia villosa]